MKLRWKTGDGRSGEMALEKRVIAIGSDPANDLAVKDAGLSPHHAHLMLRQGEYRVGSVGGHPVLVNGHAESGALRAGDKLKIGHLELELVDSSQVAPPPATETLDRLVWFAQALAAVSDPEQLLDTLLDLLMTALEAERGMVVTGLPSQPHIAAARGIDAAGAQADLAQVPDRLLSWVSTTAQPFVTMDVLGAGEFSGSTTVTRLGLRSLLALPLAMGGRVTGVLLLASSRPGPHFTPAGLREVRLYGVQASLLLEQLERVRAARQDLTRVRDQLRAFQVGGLFWSSDAMTRVMKLVERVAPSDLSILIQGETGTGKELVARELHRLRHGEAARFVALNCGAIPEELMESELFGHVRGAFSGATADRKGKLEEASGGTLFLDEIGDMPARLQVGLLRALQQRTITRVGENSERPVSFRLVSATHQDLQAAVQAGRFRQDLYYRIKEVEVALPALRDRPEDILMLATHFMHQHTRQYDRPALTFSESARVALLGAAWPGNVRELEGRVKRAVVLADTGMIEPSHLDLEDQASLASATLADAMRTFRTDFVRRTLAAHGGSRKNTAAALGVDPRTLYRYLEGKD